MAKSTNRKPSETDAAPVAQSSGGMSSFLVLTLITLVVVGCGVGYQKLLEEMESNNAKLVGTIVALKEELTSVKESYASINFENEIAAIGQMKEDLQATRLQQENTVAELAGLKMLPKMFQQVEGSVAEISGALDKLTANQETTVAELSGLKTLPDLLKGVEGSVAENAAALGKLAANQENTVAELSGLKTLPGLIQQVEGSVAENAAALGTLNANMNTEADRISQVKDGLSVVKSALEGLSKDVHEVRESSNAADSKSAGVAGEIESLKSSVTKLSTEAADEKAALVGKLSEAAAALEAHGGSVTERINAVESGLAAQISAATQQAVEAKQFAEESKKAAADARDVSATEMADGLELVKQNLAAILDARKNDEVKAGELAAQVAAVANGAVKASDVAGLSSQIAELQGSVAAVQKDVEEQGKNLQSAVKSFDSKANKLNANIKMNKQDVAGMREMVTNMVADNVDATEAPPSDEE